MYCLKRAWVYFPRYSVHVQYMYMYVSICANSYGLGYERCPVVGAHDKRSPTTKPISPNFVTQAYTVRTCRLMQCLWRSKVICHSYHANNSSCFNVINVISFQIYHLNFALPSNSVWLKFTDGFLLCLSN